MLNGYSECGQYKQIETNSQEVNVCFFSYPDKRHNLTLCHLVTLSRITRQKLVQLFVYLGFIDKLGLIIGVLEAGQI